MEYEISDDPQGVPDYSEGRRDGGMRDGAMLDGDHPIPHSRQPNEIAAGDMALPQFGEAA